MSDKPKINESESGLNQIYELLRQVNAAGLYKSGNWHVSQDAYEAMHEMSEVAARDYPHTRRRIVSLFGRDVIIDDTLGKGMIEFRCPDATFTAQLREAQS